MPDVHAAAKPMVHIVDDTVEHSAAMQRMLDPDEFSTRCYTSGEALLSALRWEDRGVVLLDLMMDQGCLSGEDTGLHLIRRRLPLPVLYLTNKKLDFKLAEMLIKRSPESRFLLKTYTNEELTDAIRTAAHQEPVVRARAERDRSWCHFVLVDLTPTQRVVALWRLRGLTAFATAAQMTTCEEPVVNLHRAAIDKALAAVHQTWFHAQIELRELLERRVIGTLDELAADELNFRFSGLGDALRHELAQVLGPGVHKPGGALTAVLRLCEAGDDRRRAKIRSVFGWLQHDWLPDNWRSLKGQSEWLEFLSFMVQRAAEEHRVRFSGLDLPLRQELAKVLGTAVHQPSEALTVALRLREVAEDRRQAKIRAAFGWLQCEWLPDNRQPLKGRPEWAEFLAFMDRLPSCQ